MTTLFQPLAANSASITITLNSLASSSSAGRESASIDNATNRYEDAEVQVVAALATGSPANDKAIYVYVWGSEDGSNIADNATGSDAAITLRSPTNLLLATVIPCPDSGGLTYKSKVFSVAKALGLTYLPRKWGIVVQNYTGLAFAGSGCSASYTGKNQQGV